MAVHVGEVHTDIRPADDVPAGRGQSSGGPSGVSTDERWRESRGRSEWLASRVAAEGFDD